MNRRLITLLIAVNFVFLLTAQIENLPMCEGKFKPADELIIQKPAQLPEYDTMVFAIH
jgi:hypothetical protein